MLVNELERLRDELTGFLPIQVVYQPDWPLLERPFWFLPPFMHYAPHTVAVGMEDEFWIILQWLEMASGPVFLPMILARSHKTGEWLHSMQDDYDIWITTEESALVQLVDKAVDGNLFALMGHIDQEQALAQGISRRVTVRINPVGWKVDPLLNRRITGSFANRKLWKTL